MTIKTELHYFIECDGLEDADPDRPCKERAIDFPDLCAGKSDPIDAYLEAEHMGWDVRSHRAGQYYCPRHSERDE